MDKGQHILNTCALAALLLLTAVSAVTAEEGEPTWHETFNGHEMWMTSLDEAMTASSKAEKPLLIDVFSPT